MKPNSAGEDMCLRTETPYEKLKQDAQTQNAYGIQAMSVSYMTQLEAISQEQYVSWEGGSPSPCPPHVSSEGMATQHTAL